MAVFQFEVFPEGRVIKYNVLGTIAMSKYYTIFDLEKKQIGFVE